MAQNESQLEKRLLGLERYDAMLMAIAECHRVDEAKEIRDKARALEVYAGQAVNYDAEYRAAEIRIRAERRTGELLKEAGSNGQRALSGGENKKSKESQRPTLSTYGISADQSSTWQRLAEIPEKDFEQALQQPGISTEGIIRRNSPQPKIVFDSRFIPVSVLGALRRFTEKDDGSSMIERDPRPIVANMTERERQETASRAPAIADWLCSLAKEARDYESN